MTVLATVATFAHAADWDGDPPCEQFPAPVVIFTTHGGWRIDGVRADPSRVVLGHACVDYRCSHRERTPTDRTLYLELDEARVAPLLAEHGIGRMLPDTRAVDATAELWAIANALERASSLSTDALALQLLARLHGLAEPTPPRPRDVVDRVRAYMEERYDEEVTLDRLAAAAHFSPFHLHRVFRSATGVTPNQYLAGVRVRRAKAALVGSDATVAEIARVVGYRSTAHFGSVFRRATGTTPTAYRKNAK